MPDYGGEMDNSRNMNFLNQFSKVLSLTAAILVLQVTSFAGQVGGKSFPDGPDLRKTPGALCERLRQIKGLFDPDPKYPRPAPGGFL